MGKIVKIAVSLLIGLVLLLIVAAVALPLLIDPNDFRDEISALVEEQTGRNLTIEGEIGFSVFPWLGIELGKMELANAPGFGDRPFAGIERADLKIKLLPLLRKQVEIKTVVLHGLDVNLARDASGKTNWEDLVSASEEPPAPAEPPQEKETATLASLQVDGIEIRNAHLSWDDRQNGVRYEVRNLNLESGALVPGQPFPLQLEMKARASQPAIGARIRFTSRVTFDLEQERYRLDAPQLFLQATGEPIPGNDLELTFDAKSIAADLKRQVARLTGIDLFVAGARITGDAKVDRLLEGQTIEGAIRLVMEEPTKLKPLLGDEPPLELAALKGIRLDVPFRADLGNQLLEVAPLSLQGLGADVTAKIEGKQIIDAPRFSGNLNLARLNLRQLLQKLAIELPPMADPNALQTLALNLDFDASLDQATVKKLVLQLDETSVQGEAGVKNFAEPAIRFDLAIDAIDVDRYLPPPDEETPPAPEKSETKGDKLLPDFELPLEPIKKLNLQGKLQLGKLKVSGLHAADIRLVVSAKEGKLRIDPLRAALYQGLLETRLSLDAGREPARLHLKTALTGLQAGPLLKDLLDDDYISGKANVTIDLRGQGATFLQLRKTLNGKAAFRFEDGAVKGINIGQMLRKAEATLTGKKLPKEEEPLKTDFSELKGTFLIKDGIVTNRDLSAKAPILRVSGEGTVNLVTEAIDYRIVTAVVGTTAGQGGKELQELKGLSIPIRITGTLAKPRIKEDLTSALKAKAQADLEKKKKALEAKLKAEEAKARAELEAKKAKAEAELKAKAKAEEAKAKAKLEEEKKKAQQKLEEELKKKAGELFKF